MVATTLCESHPYEFRPVKFHSISNSYHQVMSRTSLTITTLIALTATLFITSEQSSAQTVEIPPTITMTLSGGSGTGTGDEGPDRLTRDKIDITVTSDEPLQEPPRISVVCDDIRWTATVDGETVERNIDDFIANLTGQLNEVQAANFDYRCGEHENDITLATHTMTATGAMSWTFQWRNSTEAPYKLNDGLLTAVAQPAQSEDQNLGQVNNWDTATANFTLDTVLKSPLERGGGRIFPKDQSVTHDIFERNFVYVEFEETTTVALNSLTYNGIPAIKEFADTSNGWVLWRNESFEDFTPGLRHVSVDASDAAGNSVNFEFTFEVLDTQIVSDKRDPFVLNLYPGWNAISLPATPYPFYQDVGDVFDHTVIKTVYAHHWYGHAGTSRWHAASQRDGEWQSVLSSPFLRAIWPGIPQRQNNGYWVYSSEYVQLPIQLYWPTLVGLDRSTGPIYHPFTGWQFIGITAENRHHQFEVAHGSPLDGSYDETITVAAYLNDHVFAADNYEIAYRWNAEHQRYITLQPDDPVKIGEAIWVYYPEP